MNSIDKVKLIDFIEELARAGFSLAVYHGVDDMSVWVVEKNTRKVLRFFTLDSLYELRLELEDALADAHGELDAAKIRIADLDFIDSKLKLLIDKE